MNKLFSFNCIHYTLLAANLIVLFIVYIFSPDTLPLFLVFNIISIFIRLLMFYNLAQKLRPISLIDLYSAFICFPLIALLLQLLTWSCVNFLTIADFTDGLLASHNLSNVLFGSCFIYMCHLLNTALDDFTSVKYILRKGTYVFVFTLLLNSTCNFTLYSVPVAALHPLYMFFLYSVPCMYLATFIAFIYHLYKLFKYQRRVAHNIQCITSEVLLFSITFIILAVTIGTGPFTSPAYIFMLYLIVSCIVPIVFEHIYAHEIPGIMSRMHLQEKSNELLRHYLQTLAASKTSVQEAYQTLDCLHEQLLSCYPDSLIIVQDMSITYANQHLVDLLGLPKNHYIAATPLKQYLSENAYVKAQTIMEGLSQPGDSSGYIPFELRCCDGSLISVEGFFVRSRDTNVHSYMISIRIVSRVERERQFTKQIRSEQFKVKLFSTLSHDLKTPINIIYSAAQLQDSLIASHDIASLGAYNKMITSNCLRLLKLLNNLLDINRVEEAYLKPLLQPVEVVSFTENVLDSIQAYASRKQIHATFDTTQEEAVINADPNLLERILLNLLSNAIKYTPAEGSILVTVRITEHDAAIEVKDTGIGICDKKLPFIFDPFTRANDNTSNQIDGTGIGLSLVKSLVRLNNGTIAVKSTLHQGSTFTATFPILQDVDSMILEHSASQDGSKVDIEFSDVF